jgi:hypothetical protein
LKKIIQGSRKYGQKGRLVKLLFDVIKKIFYDKSWLFSKESTWHRSPWVEMGRNGPTMAFFGQKLTFIVNVECLLMTPITLSSLAPRPFGSPVVIAFRFNAWFCVI